MNRRHCTAVGLAAAAVVILTGPVFAVDGVILIDQNRALAGGVTPGDAPGFPITLTRGGSYRLSSDLSIADIDTTAISIETNQSMAIDLNGFTIRGSNFAGARPCQAVTPGKGIGTGLGNSNNVEIRNGAIERMGCDGILLIGFDNRVENVRVRNNGATGVQITGIIKDSVISSNGGEGITSFSAVVTGNFVNDNDKEGIVLFRGVVSNNNVSQNTDEGLFVPGSGGNPGTPVAYSNNTFTGNNGGGAQVFGGIQTGSNLCGTNVVAALCP